MGDTLEVSVSFGRYENDDALSWGKWSSFSPNKYLEEAQKCKTTGSVAQKKAYFEAHYKKIAAKKIEQIEKEKKEQLEQAKKIESLDEPHFQDHSESTQFCDSRFGLSNGEEEKTRVDMNNNDVVDEPKVDVSLDMEGTILETSDNGEVPEVEEQNFERGSQDNLKEIPQVDNAERSSSAKKSKTPKQNLKNTARKVHPTSEDRISVGTKKKPVSLVTKSSRISTPTSKPVPTSKVISSSQPSVKKVNGLSYQRSSNAPIAQSNKLLSRSINSPSQSSTKKLNGSTLQRRKNSPILKNKRIAPTSMHMSLSLGPPDSTASTTTMRKSLIMERMGDKDVVKRAFKAFQNNFNQGKPEVDIRYGGSKKVLPKQSEKKISASPTQRKEVERLRKRSDKIITQKCQSGTRSNSLSSGAPKDAGIDRKKANTVRPAGTRTDRSTDKLKEDITKGKIHRPGSNR
ncbi:protein WVD2-like 7 [Lycium barbarum]|uniref:protein WVD2-like 7 n=1 Tax=Lycium barbarum TaxID=112863 RepID=UPI00293E0789|nr:protein WVD2-like 7 [Lycium barbarum]